MKKIINLIVCLVLTIVAIIFPLTDKKVSVGGDSGKNAEISSLNEFIEVMSDCESYTFSGSFNAHSNINSPSSASSSEMSGNSSFYKDEAIVYCKTDMIIKNRSVIYNSETTSRTSQIELEADIYYDRSDIDNVKRYIKFSKMITYFDGEITDFNSVSNKWIDFSKNSLEFTAFAQYPSIVGSDLLDSYIGIVFDSLIVDKEYFTQSGKKFSANEEYFPEVYSKIRRNFSCTELLPLEDENDTYQYLKGSFDIDLGNKQKPKFVTNMSYSDTSSPLLSGDSSTDSLTVGGMIVSSFELSNINNTKIEFPSNAEINSFDILEKIIGGDENV